MRKAILAALALMLASALAQAQNSSANDLTRRMIERRAVDAVYEDLDAGGARLNGANRYTVTFATDQTPPVIGFWSLTLYNEHHFLAPNEISRYSLGTRNKTLKYNPDGSLTIYVQAESPPDAQRSNWLPAPKSSGFSLYVRAMAEGRRD